MIERIAGSARKQIGMNTYVRVQEEKLVFALTVG